MVGEQRGHRVPVVLHGSHQTVHEHDGARRSRVVTSRNAASAMNGTEAKPKTSSTAREARSLEPAAQGRLRWKPLELVVVDGDAGADHRKPDEIALGDVQITANRSDAQ